MRGAAMRRIRTPSYALLATAGLCSLGCARQSSPGVIHLVPPGVTEEPLLIGRVARMGFARPLADNVEISLRLPGGEPELHLACALVPLPDRHPRGSAVFKASLIEPDGTAHPVWEQVLSPGRWTAGEVDLTARAGSRVGLVLEAAAGETPAAGMAYWATPIVTARSDRRDNVLLICIDTLRADHLSCYGYHRDTSPTLDSLASRGCLFTRAIAQSSWTLPSHASLFTSRYVRSHGVGSVWEALAPGVPTLGGVLRDAGYATGAVISSRSLDPRFGIATGFDRYDLTCCTGVRSDVRNPCTHARATAWLREWQDSPFFLFVHYWDVHAAYAPPPPYDTVFTGDVPPKGAEHAVTEYEGDTHPERPGARERDLTVALYDGEIAHTDHYVRELLHEVDRLGLSDRTLVIVTSDHGEEFLDHSGWGHGQTLYQEVIRVPLIWAEPKGVLRGRVVDQIVQLVDVAPSVLDFLGLRPPEKMEGASFLRSMMNGPAEPRTAFSEVRTHGGLYSVLRDDTKLIYSLDGSEVVAYDLAVDPAEQRPMPPTEIEDGAGLQGTVMAHIPPWELDPVCLEARLVAIGSRSRLSVSTAGRPFLAVRARGLEPGDQLRMREDSTQVMLQSDCAEGDIDGFSLDLASPATVVMLQATLHGGRLPPDHVSLGTGKHPVDGRTPMKLQVGDPRLRISSNAIPPDSSLQPGLHFWVPGERHAASVPADLDPKLQRSLRALGYLH